MNVFDEMGVYWAEIADQNQTSRQLQFLKNILKHDELALDFECGTGRHLIPLSKEGFNIVGLDVSVNLLRIAKSRWHNAVLVRADMRFLPFKPKTFADVISMDTSFGYLPSEQDDLQSLNELRAAMVSGGIFIVDVFNREHLMKRFKVYSQPEWKDYPSFLLLQERTVDVDGQKLRDIWTVRDRADGQIRVFEHIARLYELKRLQKLLEKACFKTNSIYGDYEGQSFSPESSRLILIANAE